MAAGATGKFTPQVAVVCSNCSGIGNAMSISNLQAQSNSFSGMRISVGAMDHEAVTQFLKLASPNDKPVDNRLTHAKLWVFADMYMTSSLEQLCLHKLHRDLRCLALTAESAAKVCELTTYDFEQSPTNMQADGREINPRALVKAYLKEHVNTLLTFPVFKELLITGGELVLDLIRSLSG